jgi:putative SOS response-associated peptidase YedK
MTTLSNALTSTINHERSPVLLTEEAQFATWLTEQAMGLITTSDPESCASCNPGSRRKPIGGSMSTIDRPADCGRQSP